MNNQLQITDRKSKIAIVGAGPAGASLAIRLAQKNFRVTLIERERFPRQKLCGEFISPECFRHFRELDVFDEMLSAGGERIAETVFYAPNGKSVGIPSKWFNGDSQGALSLSRAEMDLRLLEKAKLIGVEVLEDYSAFGLLTEKDAICGVKLRAKDGSAKEIYADLFVDATGRARVLGKLAEKEISRREARTQSFKIQNAKSKSINRLIGFKAHLKNAHIEKSACEIYFFRGGYGGLSGVESNLANFCFLVKAELVKEFSGDADKILAEIIFQNKRAFDTLRNAAPVHEWLAVSVDSFGRKDLNPAANLFAAGDAGAFIDPFTGSGMLMAFESAEILAEIFAENHSSLAEIAFIYQSRHNEKFRKRLRVCSLMRRAAFSPALAKAAISILSVSRAARELLARSTRQAFPANENIR